MIARIYLVAVNMCFCCEVRISNITGGKMSMKIRLKIRNLPLFRINRNNTTSKFKILFLRSLVHIIVKKVQHFQYVHSHIYNTLCPLCKKILLSFAPHRLSRLHAFYCKNWFKLLVSWSTWLLLECSRILIRSTE